MSRSRAAGSYAVGLEPVTRWPSHVDGPESGKSGLELSPGESLLVDRIVEVQDSYLFGSGDRLQTRFRGDDAHAVVPECCFKLLGRVGVGDEIVCAIEQSDLGEELLVELR